MILPTIKIENAFSIDELEHLRNLIDTIPDEHEISYVHKFEGPTADKIMSKRKYFYLDQLGNMEELIKSKLPNEVATQLISGISFRLKSFLPYEIHCDYNHVVDNDKVPCLENEEPYYIIIIPLYSSKSKTMILNQQGKYLHFVDYKNDHAPLPESEQISEDDFKKDFSHCWPQERPYISVRDEFIWNEGDLIAFDLKLFHSSNDFTKFGVKEKQCITLQTKRKIK